jgi:glycerate kinase
MGQPVQAAWGVLGGGETAVVEVAAAAGLPLVPPERRDPRVASTFGVGELVRAALDAGHSRVIVGLGGSATSDGGAGMLRALGARFLDAGGGELPDGGAALMLLERVDLSGLDRRLTGIEIVAACDVDAVLTGPRGAAALFGPQKGATAQVVAELDAALERYAAVARATTGRDAASTPGSGAAGGLAAGFLYFTPARLRPGVEVVLEAMGFDRLVRGASLVVTGEGRTDAQTALGKAPAGVAAVARRLGVPVLCIAGALGEGAGELLSLGVDALECAVPEPMSLEECMARAEELLEAAAERACRLLRLGMRLGGGERPR